MEQHAVPRQITTFEFKLIGFFTLKQFGYLAFFSIAAVILFYIIPIPIVNIFIAAICAIFGLAIVFVPYNDRSLDIWAKNFLKKLFSPSQFYYIKKNPPPYFLRDVFVPAHSTIVNSHVDAKQKLSSYLQKTAKPPILERNRKQVINQLITNPGGTADAPLSPQQTPVSQSVHQGQKFKEINTAVSAVKQQPFLYGVIKNSKAVPLPNVLVYIKDKSGKPYRILKTNRNGVFATYHNLPSGLYTFEIKDLGQKYFFDTMEYMVSGKNQNPLNFVSRELV